ncbi:MAG: pyridoxine 5'-phosphate synthase [Pirellula sp.]
MESGVQGITVHPRPDQRHIRTDDVDAIAILLQDWPDAEFNIEGNPFHNLMEIVRRTRPDQATFVPDSVSQPTSDHGWDLKEASERLVPLIQECHDLGVRVSLFLDPVVEQVLLAKKTGADRIELYTESWATAFNTDPHTSVLAKFASAASAARDAGLGINAGHDLNLENLTPFLRGVHGVAEVSIGHALISDALEMGYANTVRAYLSCIQAARSE